MAGRVALLREWYEALSSRDVETMLEMLHPDVGLYPSPRFLDIEARYHGRAGAGEVFSAYIASFERYRHHPERFIETSTK